MQDGIAGKKLSTPLQVEVRDEDRNPVEGVNVTFTIKAGGGTLSGKGPDGLPVSGAAISVPTNSLGIASAEISGFHATPAPFSVGDDLRLPPGPGPDFGGGTKTFPKRMLRHDRRGEIERPLLFLEEADCFYRLFL